MKQGGVISPVLFCIYIDNLLLELSTFGFGCFIGEVFLGALAYADDIVLWHPPTEQCELYWLFVTNLLVNIMLFSMAMVSVDGSSQSFGGVTAQQIGWIGLRVGGHPALSLHSSNEPGELSQ